MRLKESCVASDGDEVTMVTNAKVWAGRNAKARYSHGTVTNVTTVTPELRAAFHKVGKSYERYIDWPARIAEYRES